jgi:putative ABC transport system permease protein
MNLFDLLFLSLRTLRKNKLRSGLTVLGVVIGIAAVTAMVSIGQSAAELVKGEFQNLGTNVLLVFPARAVSGGIRQGRVTTLTAADTAAVASECPAVRAASPLVFTGGQIIGGNVNWNPAEMRGVGPDYLQVRNWPLAAGDFISERDVAGAAKVCVIGQTIANRLFSGTDPLGQTIRVKNIPFTVIGLLNRKGANLVGEDQDDILLMPYTTVRKRLQGSNFANIDLMIISAASDNGMRQAEQEVRDLLLQRHKISPGQPADFHVENTTEIARVLNIITTTLTLMLVSIAAISLVVGGVGIMNIMLVSVTERTREIGVRMALGARPRDILRQFLVEAVVLSSIGGLIGSALGIGGSIGMTAAINAITPASKWPYVISVPAAIAALLFAAAVGIFFGFFPARRASQLDPIESLRYE